MRWTLRTASTVALACLMAVATPPAVARPGERLKAETGHTGPLSIDGLAVDSDGRGENLYRMKFKATNNGGEVLNAFSFKLTTYGPDGRRKGAERWILPGELSPVKSAHFELQFQTDVKLGPEDRLVLEWGSSPCCEN